MDELIDIHPHVISPDTDRYPLSPLGGNQSTWSKHPVSYDDLVRAMDEAGVAKAVVVQASTAYGHDNTYLAEAVAAHPDRLTGVCSVDVLAQDAIAVLKGWQDRGMVGLRLFTTGSTMPGQAGWLDDPRSFPVWDYAAETGLPICVQMQPEGIVLLRNLLDRFPRAKVVIDHLARPVLSDGPPYAAAAGLFGLAAYPGVHLKLTLRNILAAGQGNSTVPAFLSHLIGAFGANRIAWGSNYPAAEKPLAELVAAAGEAFVTLSDDDRRWLTSGTARALYPVLNHMQAGVRTHA